MPSLKGIKEKCLLGDNPTLLLIVFVCSHDQATTVIMFYCFCFNKVPSKAFGIVWMIVDLNLCKNRNFCAQSRNFENSLECSFELKFLQVIIYKFSMLSKFLRISGVIEVWLEYRLLQTVLFLTDSVLNAQLACFLISMAYIAQCKLCK